MKCLRRQSFAAPVALALMFAAASVAHAQAKWTGAQSATFTGSSIFTVNGNSVTVTQGSGPTYLNFGSGAQQLLGIDGIWVVSSTGGSVSGATAVSSSITGTSGTTTWTAESSPAGFGGQSGYGNSSKDNWIQLVDDTTLGTYGKSSDGYDTGVFDLNLSSASNYEFGIDYLIANGEGATQTGRAYFSLPPSPPQVNGVPEPSAWVGMLLGAGVLAAFAAGRRVKTRATAV